MSLLPDFYLYSIGTTPITGDDRRNATLSPFDDLTVARSRSNIPMCACLNFSPFFFLLLNFSHGDPLPDAGRRRSSFAHRDVRPTSLSIFLRAAFRRFVIRATLTHVSLRILFRFFSPPGEPVGLRHDQRSRSLSKKLLGNARGFAIVVSTRSSNSRFLGYSC